MARARRAWSDIRPAIRRLLRETDETDPYWTNALLLDLFNDSMDKRTMECALSSEGWVTDEYTANIVANQREYSLPEGAGRVKRVSIVKDDVEYPLQREERWSQKLDSSPITTVGWNALPSFRLVGELVVLEPPVSEAITAGLRIDNESTLARLTADGSKLSTKFPGILETLLKYDTAIGALRVESAQSATVANAALGENLLDERNEIEARWLAYIEERTNARVFTEPMYFGD
jgi:hypothetical protein